MFKKLKKQNNKGFTLVELLVVIAIIGILAVVAVPSLFKNIDKAKASQVVTNVKALKTEILTEYANSNTDAAIVTTMTTGTYIKDLLELDSTGAGSLGETYTVVDRGTNSDNTIAIEIDCKDAEKAKVINKVLTGSAYKKTGETSSTTELEYVVGRK